MGYPIPVIRNRDSNLLTLGCKLARSERKVSHGSHHRVGQKIVGVEEGKGVEEKLVLFGEYL